MMINVGIRAILKAQSTKDYMHPEDFRCLQGVLLLPIPGAKPPYLLVFKIRQTPLGFGNFFSVLVTKVISNNLTFHDTSYTNFLPNTKDQIMRTTCHFFFFLLLSSQIIAQTTVSGVLNSNTTWTKAAGPYIVQDDVTVAENVTLSIEAGTIVKFHDHWDDIIVNGSLIANGTSANPIIFTSFIDDAHGGDTNGDGTATTPAANQWGAIWFNATSSDNTLNHCWIGYGGGAYTSAMVNTYTSDLNISNSTFAHSAERGVWCEYSSPDFANNHFQDNATDGIYFNGLDASKNLSLTNNTFVNNGNFAAIVNLLDATVNITLDANSSTGSAHNGFGLAGHINGAVTFDANPNFPFIVWEDVTVNEIASLTFTPGTTVKFNDHWDDIFVNGALIAQGTETQPITFTSLYDDARDGDCSSDGDATPAAPNQWGAIWLYDTGGANILDHCWIGYGGGAYTSAMLNTYTSDLDITNSTFAHSEERGVWCENASPGFANNHFQDNATDGIYFNGLDPSKNLSLTNNTFINNGNFAAIVNLLDATVNITLNANSSTGSAHNGFGLAGHINGAVTFDANPNFPFIVWEDVTVNESASLTFTPGTTVKFNDHWDDLYVHGRLIAQGTETQPITFTSLYDDEHDGDASSDGDATPPAPDQWGAIWFYDTGGANVLEHCWIGYGGGAYTSALVNTYTSNLDIISSTFSNSPERGVFCDYSCPDFSNNYFQDIATDGIYFNGLDPAIDLTLTGNTFENTHNFAAIADLLDATVDIILENNSSTGSAHNGFAVKGHINGPVYWSSNPGFPLIVFDDVVINENASLSLPPGTTVKFNDHWDDIYVNGQLVAGDIGFAPVTFTSLHDDSIDGDTNGNGTETVAEPDQWGAIWFNPTSTYNVMENCWLGYGGGAYTSAVINILTSSLQLFNSTVAYSAERGIYIENASPPLANNIIRNNSVGLFTAQASLPTLTSNDIFDNTDFGIYNADPSVEVNALDTWWGHLSGPQHATKNPEGQGNDVSDYVLFQPWSSQPNNSGAVGVDDASDLNKDFEVLPCYPNPFIERTNIEVDLKTSTRMTIEVFNHYGQVVATITDGTYLPGNYIFEWNAQNNAAGTYWCKVRLENSVQTIPLLKVE
jgi:parallel beta-helix repeat protein